MPVMGAAAARRKATPQAVPAAAPRRRLSWLRLSVALAMLALGGELLYILLASPRLAIRSVLVRGEDRVAQEVRSKVQLPPNTNIFRAPLGQLRRQVESVPAVRSAQVSRRLPNRLLVTFERREPIAVIRRGENATLVDPEAVPFTVAGEWGWGLPELDSPRLARAGPRSPTGQQDLQRLVSVLQALGPDPRLRVSWVQLGRDERVELVLESGAVVNLGEPTELATKARLLVAVIEKVGLTRIHRMDLSDTKGAYWEPRGGK